MVLGFVFYPRKAKGGRPAWKEGQFLRQVRSPYSSRCLRCEGPINGGYLMGGDFIIWSDDGRGILDRERLDDSGGGTLNQPALRCKECRLVWFEY